MDWDDIYVMDLSLNCTGRYGSVFTSSMVDQYADQAILLGLVQIWAYFLISLPYQTYQAIS